MDVLFRSLFCVTGKVKHLIFPVIANDSEAIPNYTGRIGQWRTCIVALLIGDCFVAHSSQWRFFLPTRHCEAQGGWCVPRNEAIPNCAKRIERHRTCIAALLIGDCFVAHSSQWRFGIFYAAFEIYFTKLLLATGNKVCSNGKLISLAT